MGGVAPPLRLTAQTPSLRQRLAAPVGSVNAQHADHSPILRRHRLHEHRAQEKDSVTRATVKLNGETICAHPVNVRKRAGGSW